MTNTVERESRPTGNRAAITKIQGDESTPQSIALAADALILARRVDYAVLVVAQRRDGVLVSQVFTTLAAAEKKVTRTRDRGLLASLTLVRLTPVVSTVDPAEALGWSE